MTPSLLLPLLLLHSFHPVLLEAVAATQGAGNRREGEEREKRDKIKGDFFSFCSKNKMRWNERLEEIKDKRVEEGLIREGERG